MKGIIHLVYGATIILLVILWQMPIEEAVEQRPESLEPNTGMLQSDASEVTARGNDGQTAVSDARLKRIQELEQQVIQLQQQLQKTADTPQQVVGQRLHPVGPQLDLANRVEAIIENFDEQAQGSNWSAETQIRLYDLTLTDERLRDFQITDVDCRDTGCRLEFLSGSDRPNQVSSLLSAAINEADWGQNNFMVIVQHSSTEQPMQVFVVPND